MFMDPLFLTQKFVIKLLLLISYEGPSQSGPKEKDGLLVPLGKVYTLLTDHLITGKPLWFEPAQEKWFKLNHPSSTIRHSGLIGWLYFIGLSHIRVSTHVSTAYRDTKGTSHVRRIYVGIRSSYSSIRSSYSSYAEVLRFFMCALKNS